MNLSVLYALIGISVSLPEPVLFIADVPSSGDSTTIAKAGRANFDREARRLGYRLESGDGYTLWVKGDPFRTWTVKRLLLWISEAKSKVSAEGALYEFEVSESREDDVLVRLVAKCLNTMPESIVRPQKVQIIFGLSASNGFLSNGQKHWSISTWPGGKLRPVKLKPEEFEWTMPQVTTFSFFEPSAIAKGALWQKVWRDQTENLRALQEKLLEEEREFATLLVQKAPKEFQTAYLNPPESGSSLSSESKEFIRINPGIVGIQGDEVEKFLSGAVHSNSIREVSIEILRQGPSVPHRTIRGLRDFLTGDL